MSTVLVSALCFSVAVLCGILYWGTELFGPKAGNRSGEDLRSDAARARHAVQTLREIMRRREQRIGVLEQDRRTLHENVRQLRQVVESLERGVSGNEERDVGPA